MPNLKYFIGKLLTMRDRRQLRILIYLLNCIPNPLFFLQYLHLFNSSIYNEAVHIINLIIAGCGCGISKKGLRRALYKKPFIAKMDECLFFVDSLWSYFHSSLCGERETYQFIFKNFRSGGVFVDIGANVGGYTIRLARLGRVYAFEPHPLLFAKLKYNLNLNHIQHSVVAKKVCVSNKAGYTKLAISRHMGKHSIVLNVQDKLAEIIVESTTLDDELINESHIEAIKIDAEGAEPLILEGANKTLQKTRIVVVETSLPEVRKKVFNHLISKGFKYLKTTDLFNSIFVKELPSDF